MRDVTEVFVFDFLTMTKALTDENRIRILMALRGRELCVCQITGFLDLSPSTTSKHLSILRQARLIDSRKNGKWVYYSLMDKSIPTAPVQETLRILQNSLKDDPMVREDEERIRQILQREAAFCSPNERGASPDHYHSLEIHSLEEALP